MHRLKDPPHLEKCSLHMHFSFKFVACNPPSLSTIHAPLWFIIIHQTHYEKSDWSRAFNQFTIACELDMINAISATDIAFIMSSQRLPGY